MAAKPTSGVHTPRGYAFYHEGVGYVIPGAAYWVVKMGTLDRLNGPTEAWFPSESSAHRFAVSEKLRAQSHVWYGVDGTKHCGVDREVDVVYPDGYVFNH